MSRFCDAIITINHEDYNNAKKCTVQMFMLFRVSDWIISGLQMLKQIETSIERHLVLSQMIIWFYL